MLSIMTGDKRINRKRDSGNLKVLLTKNWQPMFDLWKLNVSHDSDVGFRCYATVSGSFLFVWMVLLHEAVIS